MMGGGMGPDMGGAGAVGGGSTAPADTRPLSEKYATQLAQIKEMGFVDEEKVLNMLDQCNGNVNVTLERLFTEN